MGRHSSAYGESSAVYARDLAIGAVSRLQEVLKKIYGGEFCPDAARSGYYPLQAQTCEVELPLEKDEQTEEEQADAAPDREQVPVEEQFDGSSDSSESMEGSDSGGGGGAHPQVF